MNIKQELKETIFKILSIIFPIIAFAIFDIIFCVITLIINEKAYWVENGINIITIIINVCFYMIILALSKKSYLATILTYVMVLFIYIMNQIKVIYTEEPITCFDFNFINNIGDLYKLVQGSYIKSILITILGYLFCGFLIFFIIKNFRKYEFEIKSIITRIFLFIVGCLGIIILFFQNASTKEVILKNFYNSTQIDDFNTYASNLTYYMKYGCVSGFYGVYLNSIFSEPEDYSEKELNLLLENARKNNIDDKKIEKPNIVLVFSESFWDIGNIEEIKFDKEITENFNNYKNMGKIVELVSPTFGGMSENVAFELITGAKLSYFPTGYIPVMSLFNRNVNPPSLIKELKNNDYVSKIIFGKDYYNSKNTWLKLGFDEYYEYEYDSSEEFVSDEIIANDIIKEFENKSKEEKWFYMVETIENHMPYNEEKYYENCNISIKKSDFDKEQNEVLLSYAQGIYNADQQLKRLYEYFISYDEPTIIIFLGDHLPKLDTNKGLLYNDSKYFEYDKNEEYFYKLYNTQSLILSNYNADFSNIPDCLGTDLLLTTIINQMDVEISDYYKWLYSTKDILPASNKYISVDSYNNIYSTVNLEDDMQRIYKLRELMQYKFFIKEK